MKKSTPSILVTLFIITFFPLVAHADLINPDYYTAKCDPGEIKVECRFKSSEPFGPLTLDECKKYKQNPNYRFLDSEGSSFGGRAKYCYKSVSTNEFIRYHINALLPLLLITLILETPISLLLVSRTKKVLYTVLSANLISVPLLYLATMFLPLSGFTALLAMELVVIIFEALLIKFLIREIGFRKILMYSIIANAVSVILGTVVLISINSFSLIGI